MVIDRFAATPDLVGRRVRVGWTLTPAAGETLADAPRQTLRRKTRDFQFVQPFAVPDPYLVYDSVAFPPVPGGGVTVTDLPSWETVADGQRTLHEIISVADDVGGRPLERLRRTVETVFGNNGHPLSRRIEILDTGAAPLALEPGVACYYQLFSPAFTATQVPAMRAIATPGTPFGLNKTLYDMLPGVHRQFDVVLRAPSAGSDSIPEAGARSGQLRRLLDVYGAMLDSTRSSAENLWSLHDIDAVDARRLPLIADWLGWTLGDADAVPLARNELKSTARLYASVGSVTSLRAIVTRYTGWTTQVAEFAQAIARSNDAPRWNLAIALPSAGTWASPIDVSAPLGFSVGNREAFGVGTQPAQLTGALAEPFTLFDGAELTLSVDGAAAFVLRFAAHDFADSSAATAAEVVAAINAVALDTVASVAAGRVRLATRSIGPDAAITVVDRIGDALTLDAAAPDRAAAVVDGQGRIRLIASDAATTPDPAQRADDRLVPGRLVCKTWGYGQWRGSVRLPAPSAGNDAGRAHPAVAALADGRLLTAWITRPSTASARIEWSLATSRPELAARIQGRAGPRFALVAGTRVTLRSAGGPQVAAILAGDYADLAQATSAEVALAFNAQWTQAVVSVAADGTLRITSTALGPLASLAIDLAQSTAARTLGLAHAAMPVFGSWDDTLDFTAAEPASALPTGWLTELCALTQDAGARFAWSEHAGGRWCIRSASWLGPVSLLATAAGLVLRAEDGSVSVIDSVAGLPTNAVRDALVDAQGALWVATSAGVARRTPALAWQVFDIVAGLASNNVWRLALAADGAVWAATAGGLSRIAPAGGIVNFSIVDGLANNDVRALAIEPSGAVWAATAGGLSRRDAAGAWFSVHAPQIPSDDVRDIALDASGQAWAATAAGLGLRNAGGAWSTVSLPLAAGTDLRSVAATGDGLWIAAATGAWRHANDGAWRGWTSSDGLPSADVRHVARAGIASAGTAWVATAAGAAIIAANGAVTPLGLAQGLPSLDTARWVGPWSAATTLTDGGLAESGLSDREPTLVREAAGTLLLLWSRRLPAADTEDRRGLRAQRFDPAKHTWSAVAAVTTPAALTPAADVQPGAQARADGTTRIFFSSDRAGGRGLWECTLDATLLPRTPSALPNDENGRIAPLPVVTPAGALMLIHRCDASVCVDQLSPHLAGASAQPASTRVPEAATLRRHGGSITPLLRDTARLARRHLWGDPASYTPHRPVGSGEPELTPAEFYTRGTVGLYVSRGRFGQPLTRDNAARLKQLLAQFLPINLRAVIILAPPLTLEVLYGLGTDIAESYLDNYPFVDHLGAIADAQAALLPDWAFLLSNELGSRSADPAALATLRRRSVYLPPQ